MGAGGTGPTAGAAPAWRHATGALSLDRPRILGIVNVTPDSFSDGGQLATVDDARRHVDQLVAEGADVIDIGGNRRARRAPSPLTKRRSAVASFRS